MFLLLTEINYIALLGDILHNAANFGCSGAILYSDPAEVAADGISDVYPKTFWLPGSGIQRGTVGMENGDPETPTWPSVRHAFRVDGSHRLAPIPAQPIGYDDARQIFLR